MILVVFGHVMMTTFNIGGYNSVIGSFFLTFRMPMFFFISGYIAYKSADLWCGTHYRKMLKKKSFVQIIPASLWFILFSLCHGHNSIPEILGGAISKGFGSYWFTFVLFEMFCIYYTASLIANHTKSVVVDIILVCASLLGIVWLNVSSREGGLYNFLCIENLSKYMQFFTFGILCRKYNKQFMSFISKDAVRGIIILLFMVCFYLYYDEYLKTNYKILFAFNHDILVRYAGLLTVFIFFWGKSGFFNKDTWLTSCMLFVGRRTLDIYLLHFFFIPNLQWLYPYIAPTNMLLIQLVFSLVIALLVVGVSILVSEVIRSSNILGHYCFGIKLTKGK